MNTPVDMTGQRFGRLTAVRATDKRLDGAIVWECLCDCGRTCDRSRRNLRNGGTTSCGCKRAELLAGVPRHGMSNTRTWRAWASMRRRCDTPSMTGYDNYGGRGITVCVRWDNSFEAFLDDMGECPAEMEIDRIDTNGNYEPGNCRWTTEQEQQNNKRSNVRIEINGETKTLTQWARQYGIRPGSAFERVRRGWQPAEAVTTPCA